jgi:hypothetical protein
MKYGWFSLMIKQPIKLKSKHGILRVEMFVKVSFFIGRYAGLIPALPMLLV